MYKNIQSNRALLIEKLRFIYYNTKEQKKQHLFKIN